MLLHIPDILTREEVTAMRKKLDGADWIDGRATVGSQGGRVKRNQQIQDGGPIAKELGAVVLRALDRHPTYFSAALPLRIVPPLFNRYQTEETYGFHVDGAVRAFPGSPGWLRTDLSATLFLCDPDEYDGGVLTVRDTYGEHEVKLPAGDMVLYPSTSLHAVSPVTRGVRTCSFFWIQSMVRQSHQRSLLFDLDRNITALRGQHGESEQTVSLANCYHNLLREWSEV